MSKKVDIGKIKFETTIVKKENMEIELPPHNNPSYRAHKESNFLGLYKNKSDQISDVPRKFDLN